MAKTESASQNFQDKLDQLEKDLNGPATENLNILENKAKEVTEEVEKLNKVENAVVEILEEITNLSKVKFC